MDKKDKQVICFLILGFLIAIFFGHSPDWCGAYPEWCEETYLAEANNE